MTVQRLTHMDRGDMVRAEVLFKNLAGVATDPTEVLFSLIGPSGAASQQDFDESSEQVTNPSVGTWRMDFVVDDAGDYLIKCAGSGAVTQTVRGVIQVDRDPFTP